MPDLLSYRVVEYVARRPKKVVVPFAIIVEQGDRAEVRIRGESAESAGHVNWTFLEEDFERLRLAAFPEWVFQEWAEWLRATAADLPKERALLYAHAMRTSPDIRIRNPVPAGRTCETANDLCRAADWLLPTVLSSPFEARLTSLLGPYFAQDDVKVFSGVEVSEAQTNRWVEFDYVIQRVRGGTRGPGMVVLELARVMGNKAADRKGSAVLSQYQRARAYLRIEPQSFVTLTDDPEHSTFAELSRRSATVIGVFGPDADQQLRGVVYPSHRLSMTPHRLPSRRVP